MTHQHPELRPKDKWPKADRYRRTINNWDQGCEFCWCDNFCRVILGSPQPSGPKDKQPKKDARNDKSTLR